MPNQLMHVYWKHEWQQFSHHDLDPALMSPPLLRHVCLWNCPDPALIQQFLIPQANLFFSRRVQDLSRSWETGLMQLLSVPWLFEGLMIACLYFFLATFLIRFLHHCSTFQTQQFLLGLPRENACRELCLAMFSWADTKLEPWAGF